MPKRKRASGVGTYTDQETGEVVTVQTTKAARAAHRKSGAKWYKEPTEAELRMWERDDKRRAFVEEQERKAELKWKNAEKRRQKEERDQLIQQDLFEQGKITFTQTLGRKDEDQRNLHRWLDGRSRSPGAKESSRLEGEQDTGETVTQVQGPSTPGQQPRTAPSQRSTRDGELRFKSENSQKSLDGRHASDTEITASQYQAFLQDDLVELDPTTATTPQSVSTLTTRLTQLSQRLATLTQVERNVRSVVTARAQPTLGRDKCNMANPTDFDIAIDGDVSLHPCTDCAPVRSVKADEAFKVPALPSKTQSVRQALSPLSKSDLNKRGSTGSRLSSVGDKWGVSTDSFEMPGNTVPVHDTSMGIMLTQGSVQNLLAGICTQDLSVDDEELSEKENTCPIADSGDSTQQEQMLNVLPSGKPMETTATASKSANDSFTSADYDEVFADIDPDMMVGFQHTTPAKSIFEHDDDSNNLEDDFNFGDDELDDDTLLSLPATQMVRSSAGHHSIYRRTRTTPPPADRHREAELDKHPPHPSLTQFLTEDLPCSPSPSPSPTARRPACTRMPFSKNDSFAMPGLSDDDLLEGLQEFEEKTASQQRQGEGPRRSHTQHTHYSVDQYDASSDDRPRSAPACATSTVTTETVSKGRVSRHSSSLDNRGKRKLPW